jgi:soluble lytic murein transglycosylase
MSTHSSSSAAGRRRSGPTAAQLRARERRATRRRRAIGVLFLLLLAGAGFVALSGRADDAMRSITLPLDHQGIIREQAAAKDLDPALVAAVIYRETHFRPRTSSAGAEGLMQLTPDTARFIAGKSGGTAFTVDDLATPKVNIAYGSWYLRYLMQRYDRNTKLALAAYNGGEGNVDKWLASARAAGHDFGLDDIPFPETRAYVANVLASQKEYRATYAKELGLH